jgi:cellulose synthase/poly-beta-1,6-N-acetylglucosamine synthase-like glycosyltransferase
MARRRSGLTRSIGFAAAAPAAGLASLNVYLAALTVLAWRRQPPSRVSAAITRFAVLVPAHDEEAVIARTLESLVGQHYPADRVTVHVVADNCTDATAVIARGLGATVHERVDAEHPGKGPALGWLVDRLRASGEEPDAMVIVDADTVLDPGFLVAADAALAGGHDVVQGYYTVSEPDRSSTVAIRYIALALRHYVRPLGRQAIGGSCGLFGNGMVFRSAVLADRRFSAHLTEDAEMQLQLLLDGVQVAFAPDAVLRAEMPDTTAAAATQNERWELGRMQLVRRYVPRLLRDAMSGRQPVASVDAALDAVVPPLSVLAVATSGALAGTTALRVITRGRAGRSATRLAVCGLLGLVVHVGGGLRIARVPRRVARSLLAAPHYAMWKAALWVRVVTRPEDVRWSRTQRNAEAVTA